MQLIIPILITVPICSDLFMKTFIESREEMKSKPKLTRRRWRKKQLRISQCKRKTVLTTNDVNLQIRRHGMWWKVGSLTKNSRVSDRWKLCYIVPSVAHTKEEQRDLSYIINKVDCLFQFCKDEDSRQRRWNFFILKNFPLEV